MLRGSLRQGFGFGFISFDAMGTNFGTRPKCFYSRLPNTQANVPRPRSGTTPPLQTIMEMLCLELSTLNRRNPEQLTAPPTCCSFGTMPASMTGCLILKSSVSGVVSAMLSVRKVDCAITKLYLDWRGCGRV